MCMILGTNGHKILLNELDGPGSVSKGRRTRFAYVYHNYFCIYPRDITTNLTKEYTIFLAEKLDRYWPH